MIRIMQRSLAQLSTEEYLTMVHKRMIQQINNRSMKSAQRKAEKLESFLNVIKSAQLELKNNYYSKNNLAFPFSKFWSSADQIALLNKMYSIHPNLFKEMRFINTGNDNIELGLQLEIGIAQVIKTMDAIGENTKYDNTQISLVGQKQIQVKNLLLKKTTDIERSIFNNYYNEISNELHRYNKETNNGFFSYMHSVSGKIDNIGLKSNFKISSQVTGIEKDIITTLKGATFTDKNYISTNTLKLGQTNPFRVFATVSLGSPQTVTDQFYRMLSCFKHHDQHQPKNYGMFYKIRALYELTGIGAKYTTKSLIDLNPALVKLLQGNYAKFLIWNNPLQAGKIRVIPTQVIANKIIEKIEDDELPANWQDAMYSTIKLKQIDLKEI